MSEFTFSIKKPDEEIKPKVDDNDEGDDGAGDDGANPEEESTATFKALVQLEVCLIIVIIIINKIIIHINIIIYSNIYLIYLTES